MRPKLLILAVLLTSTQVFSQTKQLKLDSTNGKLVNDTFIQHFKDSFDLKTFKPLNQNVKVFIKDEPIKTSWFKDILPILTLILGILLNRGIDFFTNRKKIKKHGERWMAELNVLKDPIKKQIEYLQTFKEEHDKEKFDIPKLNVVSILDGESFNSLDKSELIKYLETFKGKKYDEAITLSTRVNIFVSILKNHLKNLQIKFDDYLKGTSSHTNNLSKYLQDFLQRFALYGVQLEKELHGDPLNDPRYRPLFDLVNTEIYPYMTQGNYDVYQLESNFLIPSLQFFGHYRLEDRIFPLAESIRNSITSIKGIKMEKHYFSENLKILIERYSEELTQLNEILKDIEQKTAANMNCVKNQENQ